MRPSRDGHATRGRIASRAARNWQAEALAPVGGHPGPRRCPGASAAAAAPVRRRGLVTAARSWEPEGAPRLAQWRTCPSQGLRRHGVRDPAARGAAILVVEWPRRSVSESVTQSESGW